MGRAIGFRGDLSRRPARRGQTREPHPVRAVRTGLPGQLWLRRGDLLFDLLSLGLVFLALRCQPGFGPLAVAYAAANIASAIPLTPGGLGVIEVTMVAITVGFGAPRATAVLAVLGYRS